MPAFERVTLPRRTGGIFPSGLTTSLRKRQGAQWFRVAVPNRIEGGALFFGVSPAVRLPSPGEKIRLAQEPRSGASPQRLRGYQ